MTDTITIKQLTTMDELYQMQQVEQAVWDISPNPVHQTYTALNNGGIILGAFDGEKMIGFLYSFAGFDGIKPYLCSHMMGFVPGYRQQGLGKKMKLKQFDIARNKGYPLITWTYDPLESRNAYLNLHQLGATGAYYKPNYYGAMTDKLNKGLLTDRFQIEWDLTEKTPTPAVSLDTNRLLVYLSANGEPVSNLSIFDTKQPGWFVPIPENFQAMKEENMTLAKKWRKVTGDVFQALFDAGYTANDLLRDQTQETSYYYFSRQ
ncbi:GNAT family N-acetyltransferase [Lentibacillus cibarius]|uniref:GNAT family N-acetyltransferase n=1 Tax=Lentibacillus cibarius TaxID=2583219 RepID=A0A549YIG8_9BACI|nr:GNAT family N-acetyltransferase [Lentibacillus cibarius]TMN22881.1 GNAT family N-acetyltransferase [Lentibacillus cibarius]TRM11672.1 GNAT family N-acetyltransferase [Lentibacillus cibarius]